MNKKGNVLIREMSSVRFFEIMNGWFRRMASWPLYEVSRQLAHPGPLVGAYDSRFKF